MSNQMTLEALRSVPLFASLTDDAANRAPQFAGDKGRVNEHGALSQGR